MENEHIIMIPFVSRQNAEEGLKRIGLSCKIIEKPRGYYEKQIVKPKAEMDRVIEEFGRAYQNLLKCYNLPGINEEKKNDFYQRMDEILLIYSNLFNVSVNEARKYLGGKNE